MDTIFINSDNSKTCYPHKYIALSNLTWKNI